MVRRKYLLLITALLVTMLFSCGKKEKDSSTAVSPEATKSFERGNAYYKLGNLDSAIKEYEKCVMYDKNHKMAHYNLAVLYKEKGRYTEAIQEFEGFLKYSSEEEDKVVRSYVEEEIKKIKAKNK